VALGAALAWSRWPRFGLGMGTVAFFVVFTGAEPSVMGAGLARADGAVPRALRRSPRVVGGGLSRVARSDGDLHRRREPGAARVPRL